MTRESEQVEWKENVADPDDVVETLSAFANDLANLGGGYVVCGAKEDKDAYGFPRVAATGLTPSRLKEVEGRVMAGCRDRVSPSIAPLVQELPSESPDRRVLVFIMPATPSSHLFRRREEGGKCFVRLSRETREARNGILRELLVRKGTIEPWDRRPCARATVNDLDLLALRDALQRMRLFDPERGLDDYLSDTASLSPFVPPLLVREPLTNTLRPRNFAMLLFGRHPQSCAPGAFAHFSLYPGTDRADPHAERHDLAGTLLDQARRLIELLNAQSYLAFDKTDLVKPNALKYPPRALHEAMINALAHRDYELPDPTRITAFVDRIEIVSPGPLPLGVSLEELAQGRTAPRWRNQSLAWFMTRLELAQAEGQGISTILRTMQAEGCPPARFTANEARVICVLPAHPRHVLAPRHREIERMLAAGDLTGARMIVKDLVSHDPSGDRTVQLFAEVHRALDDASPVREFIDQHGIEKLAPKTLIALASVFAAQSMAQASMSPADVELFVGLINESTKGGRPAREVHRILTDLPKSDYAAALAFLDAAFDEQPHHEDNVLLLQDRAAVLVELASQQSGEGQWAQCVEFLNRAEADLENASSLTEKGAVLGAIQSNLHMVQALRRSAESHLASG